MYADSISYNTAIAACANFGEWKVAVALLREMIDETRRHHPSQQQEQQQEQQQRRRRRHSPRYHSRQRTVAADEFSFASAIRACGVAGQWSAALRLFETMLLPSSPSLLPPPNAVCLNAAVTALAVAGRYPQAISLVVTATQSDHLKEFAAASSSSISSSSQHSPALLPSTFPSSLTVTLCTKYCSMCFTIPYQALYCLSSGLSLTSDPIKSNRSAKCSPLPGDPIPGVLINEDGFKHSRERQRGENFKFIRHSSHMSL